MATGDNKKSRYHVQAVDRVFDILDCFSFQQRELSLADIGRQTGLNKTTAKRLVSNLAGRGYLKQDPATKLYQLGMRLFELGGIVFSAFSLRDAAALPMTRLQNETGATVLLGTAMDQQLLYLDKREGTGIIRIHSDIGWRRPLHYGMLGMVLMAHLDSKEIQKILAKTPLKVYTPHSFTDNKTFFARLEEIRLNGYVLEREQFVAGVMGIAAPIRDYSRQVIAALGVGIPLIEQDLVKETEKITALVKTSCQEISAALGYRAV